MKRVTVFTPSFNRAHTLPKLYASLLAQRACLEEWVLVDDGSTDKTEELVRHWVGDNEINIKYIKKENGGMLSAHNVAYDHIEGGICVCIDSDDHLPPNALATILREWKDVEGDPNLAGLVGLDIDSFGKTIGDPFPASLTEATFKEIRFRYLIRGDKKYVFKKEVIDEFGRYPNFPNEKYPAASYLYRKIDSKYKLKLINLPLCVVEYQEDGNSNNKFKQYALNPKSFQHFRIFCMDDACNLRERLTSATHYISSCLFMGSFKDILFNRFFYLTIPLFPVGVLLYIYVKHTRRKGFINVEGGRS